MNTVTVIAKAVRQAININNKHRFDGHYPVKFGLVRLT